MVACTLSYPLNNTSADEAMRYLFLERHLAALGSYTPAGSATCTNVSHSVLTDTFSLVNLAHPTQAHILLLSTFLVAP